jgi:hypothetical protein
MPQALLAERFKRSSIATLGAEGVRANGRQGGVKMQETQTPPSPMPPHQPAVTGSSSVTVSQSKGGSEVSDGQGLRQK